MAKSLTKRSYLAALAAVIVLVIGGWLLYKHLQAPSPLDAPMLSALAQVGKVTSYSQYVETQTSFPDRLLTIIGNYYVDNAGKEYASYSTTTLFITGDATGHSFTDADISIKDNVFYKVDTSDKLLKASIKSSPDWTTYKANAIPADKVDIAVNGPEQDNLSVLQNNGEYLTLLKKVGPVTWDNQQLLQYTFKLSSAAFAVQSGPLNALVGRVGQTGTIDVFIDPASYAVRYLLFKNAPYFATTTISNINVTSPVTPPIAPAS